MSNKSKRKSSDSKETSSNNKMEFYAESSFYMSPDPSKLPIPNFDDETVKSPGTDALRRALNLS